MADLRYVMEKSLRDEEFAPGFNFRKIIPDDLTGLGQLLFAADLGTADDEGLPVENSTAEIKNTFAGKYGKFLADCSFVAIVDNVLAAAVLITYYEREAMPLVAFTMTHPGFKNRGLCKGLLRVTFKTLKNSGHKKCFLAVNAANLPAVAAYKSVGFRLREELAKN